MRIDRMLSILVMLLNKDRVSANELAEKFEVSVRTVYRDIDSINAAGVPVISYPGNNGGFGIMDTFKIDRQLFNLKDMLNVLSTLKGVNSALEDLELETAIEKISSLVPKEKTEELNLHMEQVVIDILPWGMNKDLKEYLKKIHQALNESKLLHFNYLNSKGEKSLRSVEPLTLIFKGYTWYLFAFCLSKNDYRFFKLTRIKNLKKLDQKFDRKKVSYQDFMTPDFQKVKMVNLVLRFSPEMKERIEDYFPGKAIKIDKNGKIIVSVSYPEEEWIYGFILGYGEDVEILEPQHIREAIKEKIKKIQAVYKPDIMVS
jgi:predicted DNA-binding transcriptional regulator YafY